jgi:hypothetical protein
VEKSAPFHVIPRCNSRNIQIEDQPWFTLSLNAAGGFPMGALDRGGPEVSRGQSRGYAATGKQTLVMLRVDEGLLEPPCDPERFYCFQLSLPFNVSRVKSRFLYELQVGEVLALSSRVTDNAASIPEEAP